MTDRPFGCLLSGGLDSSLIVSILSKLLAKNNKRLDTFSIGMAGSTDIEYARMVAKHCNTIHHEVIVTKEQMLSTIPKVIEQIESYDTTSVRASTPMYILCKYIKENTDIKVIFSGEGSDEVLGGYLYFHKAPDSKSFKEENIRLLTDINFFDCLRADKCISVHGLEGRFPFLDVDFINYCMSIDSKLKMPTMERMEKYLLREAFSVGDYLPREVLWRVKEAFSDGVSKQDNSWYKIIQDHIENDQDIDTSKIYEHCQPILKESFYYRKIFDELYKGREKLVPYYWLPKWNSNETDPSARKLSNYQGLPAQVFNIAPSYV
jgi:asparagine synthase (glutamine-hydrolysing)